MILIQSFQSTASDFQQTLILDNISVSIRLTYNYRSDAWYIYLGSGEYSLGYLKLVPYYPLILNHKALFPILAGDFVVEKINEIADDYNFSYDDLGRNYGLLYFNAVEFSEWRNTYGI